MPAEYTEKPAPVQDPTTQKSQAKARPVAPVRDPQFPTAELPTKVYRVSLHDGSMETLVRVPVRQSFKRKLFRHSIETVDGVKQAVRKEIEHTYKFDDEMRSDAIRAFNAQGHALSAKQLVVEEV